MTTTDSIVIKTGNEFKVCNPTQLLEQITQLRGGDAGTTEVDMPFHSTLLKVKPQDDRRLTYTFRITFEREINFTTRVRNEAIFVVFARFLPSAGPLYVYEREGLDFRYKVSVDRDTISTSSIEMVNSRHFLPNIYDSGRVCFGSIRFERSTHALPPEIAVPRMMQSFFASTFNTDLQAHGYRRDTGDSIRRLTALITTKATQMDNATKQSLIEFLHSSDVRNVIKHTYTAFILSHITKLSVSEIADCLLS